MANIHKQVQTVIASDRAIQKDLERNLINIRALARFFQTKGVQGSTDAIISAIRRFELDKTRNKKERELNNFFKEIIITTKSNVLSIELKDIEFKTICQDFLGKNILKKNIRMIKSKENIILFLNQKEYDHKKKLFQTKNIIGLRENLAEIRLTFPQKKSEIVGLLARIGTEFSLENISIQGIIESMPEILLYIQEKDLILAHKAVINLTQK